jgi:hypothetical protein
MERILKPFEDLYEALNFAQKESEKKSVVLHVIKSFDDKNKPVYYVDDNGFLRSWEKMEATYENGVKIK